MYHNHPSYYISLPMCDCSDVFLQKMLWTCLIFVTIHQCEHFLSATGA